MRDRVRASQVQEATGMAPSKATETSTVTRPQQTTVTSQQTTVTPQQTGTVTGEQGALRCAYICKCVFYLYMCEHFLPVQEANHCPRTFSFSVFTQHRPRPCFKNTQRSLPCVARACVHAVSEATRRFDLRLVG